MAIKTFLRSFLLLTLFSILSLPFQGCGEKTEGDAAESGGTIRFAHFWSEPEQKQKLMKQIDAFKAAHPGVEVELIDLSWNDGKQKLMAMFDGNQVPDVIELGSDWVAQFSSSGRLMDLTNMPNDPVSRFTEGFMEPAMWEGKAYARPWIVAARAIFVNTGLLQEAGVAVDSFSTWESILQAGEQINMKFANEKPARYGIGVNGDDRNRLYKKIVPMFWSNGGELFDEELNPTFNTPQNVQALDFYLTLARNGKLEKQQELDQLFLGGRIGFWLSGPWLVDRIAKDNPDLKYNVIGMPTLNGHPGVGFAGGEYLAINAESDHPDLARALVTFLTSPESALPFSKDLQGGFAPADLAASNDPYLQEGFQGIFTSELARSRMTPVHPQWLEIQDVLEENVVRALKGEMTAQQALDNAQTQVKGLVQ